MNKREDLKAPYTPLDQESRVVARDHTALKLWLRLLTCTTLIEGSVSQRLRRGFSSTLPRFDLLAQLYRVPAGLRMSDLSRRLMVTGGNITGLADQLEHEGFLVREAVHGDRRAICLKLTDSGRARFAEMAHAHESWVVALMSSLSTAEQQTLLDLLGKLKLALHHDYDLDQGAARPRPAKLGRAPHPSGPARARRSPPQPPRKRGIKRNGES
ncbi:MAG: MarR family transcriptional regulator [Betaproteobacteria bacterium]|nr:MarR family transcriptional regulator [Betaproteobacteria bacterium]